MVRSNEDLDTFSVHRDGHGNVIIIFKKQVIVIDEREYLEIVIQIHNLIMRSWVVNRHGM